MPMNTLRCLVENKETLSIEEKKKLLHGLKLLKRKLEKENSITLSPQEPMNLDEDIPNKERNVIAKTFTVNGDFDSFINKNRGIQLSPKETEAILNFEKSSSKCSLSEK